MSITTYPLNGIEYYARDAAGYTATRTSGVYSTNDDFPVTPAGGLKVTVGAGQGWVRPSRFEGYSIVMRDAQTLTLAAADSKRPRIDRIVLRYDASARKTELQVLQGTPDTQPSAPAITRTALYYDLCLAEITRPAGSAAISAAHIRDTRANEALCGLMRDGVTQIPTAQLEAEARAQLDELRDSYTGGFVAKRNLTLKVSSWTNTNSGQYPWVCDTAWTSANAALIPLASVLQESKDAASAAELAQTCETRDKAVRFRARNKPTADIAVQVMLFGKSSENGSGGNSGSGGGDNTPSTPSTGASEGYTSIFTAPGTSDSDRLWRAVNTGGKYTGSNQTLCISDDVCTPGSTGISYVKWWIAYRDTYPEMDDNNADFLIRNCTFEPEGDHPILIQFLYKSGTITFENCTFRNISFWFGRDYQQVITFRNCTIEDNQYHFITTGEWNQNAEYHIEGCHFRHMRPNFEEYRADVKDLKLNGWAHGNIRSMGFNIKWFFYDTIFEDCMGALNILIKQSSHAPSDSPKLVELYMERCTIRKTNGAGISFAGQPVTGVIRDCKFYNIGANRCNEEGYDLPTDKRIMWGSGTEDDPYVYECGVGSNAIFSFNWTPRHELVISNNWMYNMMENGVEGNYRELSYNHIENTGYRMDEGMWNPSTEGIYGSFAVCKGNVIRNPYYNEPGIVITGWTDGSPCYYEDNVILYDKTDRASESVGFELMIQTDHYDSKLTIRNNDIRGFSKKFSIYNQYSVYLDAIIHDIGEAHNILSSSDMAQRMLSGIDFTSEESKEIVRDPAFYELNEDGSPTEWKTLHCKAGVYTTGQDRFLRVQGTELSACAVVAQDYHTNSDIYIARIRFQVRNDSGKIGIVPLSVKDDGNVAKDAYNMVLHPNMATFDLERDGDADKFVEVVHSMVVTQHFRLAIVNPLIDDSEDAEYRSRMDVKDVSVQLTRCQRRENILTDEALAVPGKLYDFSNQPSSYLPSNAFSVTYWIPQKNYSYGGSWTDATWMMGKNTANDEGRGRVIVNSDTKQYGQFTVWYKSHFDLELNGHTLECANSETYSFLALFNGADVHIKGPGTIKAKNFAVSLSIGCTLSIDPDVVIESTGTNANSGETNFAVVVGGGDADQRTVLNVHGGTIGKVLSYAYTDINFDISEGATATMERLQTNGKISVSKNTKLINGGTNPATEVTNPKEMTGLFTCSDLTATYDAGHTENDLVVYGDESSVTYKYVNAEGETVEGESNLTGAFGLAVSTKATRKGAMSIALAGEVYTYTGIWYGDLGETTLDLNGYSIKNDYQNYTLNLNGDCDLTIMDTNPKVEGGGAIESTQYCAIIANGITLRLGRCCIRQATGICIGGTGKFYLNDESQLEGKIGINAGANTSIVLDGGTITATNMGIQAIPQDDSTTAVTVHGGTITSDNVSIWAKEMVLDAVEGKTAALTGTLNLSQNATITNGTMVTVNGTEVTELMKASGTVKVGKTGTLPIGPDKPVTPVEPSDPEAEAVYKLAAPKQFVAGNKEYIDTGIKLFENVSAQPTWTILLDAVDFSGQAKNTSYCLLHCMTESDPWPGLCLQTTNGGRTQLNLYSRNQPYGTYTGDASAKLVTYIQIKGNQFRSGSDPATDAWGTITGYSANVAQSLLLGAYQETDGTKGRYWDGTVNRFAVYDRELTNDEITSWLNG